MSSLTAAMNRRGLGRWRKDGDTVAMTKAEFVAIAQELFEGALHDAVAAHVEPIEDELREEGTRLAVVHLYQVDALDLAAKDHVGSWLKARREGGAGTLGVYGRRIIPPEPLHDE